MNDYSRRNTLTFATRFRYVTEEREAYTPHPKISRASVVHWSRDGYNLFLLKEKAAVAQAVEQRATPIADTSLVLGL